jgi:hypothetical protein
MSHYLNAILAVSVVLGGCTSQARIRPVEPTAPDLTTLDSRTPEHSRLRRVTNRAERMQSVLFVPSAVEGMVDGGVAPRSRVFLGALFAMRAFGTDQVTGLALVVQSVGGGMGPSLSVEPTLRITADGARLIERRVDPRLYSVARGRWGPVETIMFPLGPALLERMAECDEVAVRVGDSIEFTLGSDHREGFAELLAEIPADADFSARAQPTWRPAHITQ